MNVTNQESLPLAHVVLRFHDVIDGDRLRHRAFVLPASLRPSLQYFKVTELLNVDSERASTSGFIQQEVESSATGSDVFRVTHLDMKTRLFLAQFDFRAEKENRDLLDNKLLSSALEPFVLITTQTHRSCYETTRQLSSVLLRHTFIDPCTDD